MHSDQRIAREWLSAVSMRLDSVALLSRTAPPSTNSAVVVNTDGKLVAFTSAITPRVIAAMPAKTCVAAALDTAVRATRRGVGEISSASARISFNCRWVPADTTSPAPPVIARTASKVAGAIPTSAKIPRAIHAIPTAASTDIPPESSKRASSVAEACAMSSECRTAMAAPSMSNAAPNAIPAIGANRFGMTPTSARILKATTAIPPMPSPAEPPASIS